MNFKRKSKVSSEFSLASMSDMIFLLLIFFVIASTLISPTGIKIVLPKANSTPISTKQSVTLTVDPAGLVYFNASTTPTPLDRLPLLLENELKGAPDPTVGIRADKSVAYEKVMDVIKIATKQKYRILLKTDKE